MNPKFTPGPWYPVVATKHDNTKNLIVVAGSPAIESASRIVCLVTPLEHEDAEDGPNVEAISLVPDMYQALLAARQCIDDVVEAYANACARIVLDEAVRSLKNDAGKLVKAALQKLEQ